MATLHLCQRRQSRTGVGARMRRVLVPWGRGMRTRGLPRPQARVSSPKQQHANRWRVLSSVAGVSEAPAASNASGCVGCGSNGPWSWDGRGSGVRAARRRRSRGGQSGAIVGLDTGEWQGPAAGRAGPPHGLQAAVGLHSGGRSSGVVPAMACCVLLRHLAGGGAGWGTAHRGPTAVQCRAWGAGTLLGAALRCGGRGGPDLARRAWDAPAGARRCIALHVRLAARSACARQLGGARGPRAAQLLLLCALNTPSTPPPLTPGARSASGLACVHLADTTPPLLLLPLLLLSRPALSFTPTNSAAAPACQPSRSSLATSTRASCQTTGTRC
jgi:hypothetical protein